MGSPIRGIVFFKSKDDVMVAKKEQICILMWRREDFLQVTKKRVETTFASLFVSGLFRMWHKMAVKTS